MNILQARRAAKRRSETIQLFALLASVMLCIVGAAIGASFNSSGLMLLGSLPGTVALVSWFVIYRP